ncbi:MAG: voltage-gated chloride channel protein ClcB [Herbaspirillum sp.]|nr:voltage-gated chloride channel protein ClcB [Herbaspirillum sp.]
MPMPDTSPESIPESMPDSTPTPPAWQTRLRRLFGFSNDHIMLLWAVAVGALGALTTVGFRECIAAIQLLLSGHSGSFVDMAKNFSWPLRILIPTCGGIAAGALLVWANRINAPAGKADYMEAVSIGDGGIPVRQTLLRSASSLLTIGSGGSIGREGSMVQLAALCASVLGRVAYFPAVRLRLLVACGAAAGISAAYNAPIAGAFFVSEIVLGSIEMKNFGPVVVASVVANITMRGLPGYATVYVMPAFPEIGALEIPLFVLLGLLAGVLAPLFLHLLQFSRQQFRKTALPLPLRLGLGALLMGLISVQSPEVWGNGYSVVNSMLHTDWIWSSVLSILLFKIAATALIVGSGAVGGIFTPTLFVGAALGILFGQAAHLLWPVATSAPFAYAMVGMGAFLAAATSAPLMAMLMIFEMTLSHQTLLPLMLSCVVAYFTAMSLSMGGVAMYDITLRRLREEQARLALRGSHMSDLIKPAETVLPIDASFAEMTTMFLQYPVKYIYIVDANNHYCGAVALQDVTSSLLDKSVLDGSGSKTAADYLRSNFLHVVTADMSLGEGLQRFLDHQGERLPAIQSTAQPVLLGAVYKSSLLEAYFRLDKGGQ